MPEEVIAAGKVGATAKLTETGAKRRVETNAFPSNSTLQIGLRLLAEWWSKHGVEVIQNRTVGLPKYIEVLTCAPRSFRSDSEILFEKEVSAEGRIAATTNTLRRVIDVGERVGSGLTDGGTVSERDVKLLRFGRCRKQEKRAKDGGNKR